MGKPTLKITINIAFTRVSDALPEDDRYVWVVVETGQGLTLINDEAAYYDTAKKCWGWAYSGLIPDHQTPVAWAYMPALDPDQVKALCNS